MKRCKVLEEADRGRRRTEKEVKRCGILELPLDVMFDILLRLNVQAILRCKCVCKTFVKILTDPHFVELHLTRAPNVEHGMAIQDTVYGSDLLLIYNDHDVYRPCQTVNMRDIVSKKYDSFHNLIDSCNGLLLLCYRSCHMERDTYYICNPILGEFWALPSHTRSTLFCKHVAFGFCPKSKQYKIIRFDTTDCSTFTFGGTSSSWREIGKLPFPRNPLCFRHCSLDGNLYWISESFIISDIICSFDLETEKFSYIPPPAHFNQDALKDSKYVKIGLLGGILCFSYCIGVRFEAFVMKKDYHDDDNAKEGRWTKEFTIDLITISILRDYMAYHVINFLDNGDLIIKRDGYYYPIACNLHNRRTRHLLVGKVFSHNIVFFVPSLVSLKGMAASAGVYIKVVRPKMRRNL